MVTVDEKWKSVVGYEGAYEVSDHGRVKSVPRMVRHNAGNYRLTTERILKPGRTKIDRLYVSLCDNGIEVTRLIHHLVAESFIGPRPDGMECCHNDGNSLNNIAANLRYDTKTNNEADKLLHGTHNRGERCGTHKLTETQVIAIRNDGRVQRVVAGEYGVSQQTISSIRVGKRWDWLFDNQPQATA